MREVALGGQGERQGAAPGSEVQRPQAGAGAARHPRKDLSRQQFRLRPWNQHPAVHRQIELPEGGAAQNVLQRLPAGATQQTRLERRQFRLLERPVVLEIQLEPRHPEGGGKQVLRIQASAGHVLAPQVVGAPENQIEDGPAFLPARHPAGGPFQRERAHPSSSSLSRRSASRRAPSSSSSSPCSTDSSRWSVSPMR